MQKLASKEILIFLHLQGNLYHHINLKQKTLWLKTITLSSYGLETFQKAKIWSAELNKVKLW